MAKNYVNNTDANVDVIVDSATQEVIGLRNRKTGDESLFPRLSTAASTDRGIALDAEANPIKLTNTQIDFRNLPAPWTCPFRTYFVRDVGANGSLWTSDGTRWNPAGSERICLHQQNWECDDVTDANTSQINLLRYVLPLNLFTENSTLILSAKFKFNPSTAQQNIRAYIGGSQWAVTNNGSNAAVLTGKWQGLELSNQNDAFAQLGEASGTSGGNGQQQANFLTATSTTRGQYREITIQGNFSASGSGTNKIKLSQARLELAWGA